MPDSTVTPQSQPPSSRALVRSTAIAALVAAVLLVTVVLPAEYGIDPTRIGSVLRLTPMGKIKVALEKEVEPGHSGTPGVLPVLPEIGTTQDFPSPAPAESSTTKQDITRLTLRPNEGREIKLTMEEGDRATYRWSVDVGAVNFNTHGEPPNPPRGFYHGYGKGAAARSDDGVLVAAFDGMHGWFWRNVSDADLTVTLETAGDYSEVRIME